MCCVFVCVYVCGMCHSSVVQVATNSNLPPYACGWQQAKAKKQSTKKKKEVERKSCLLWALPHKYVALMRRRCVCVLQNLRMYLHTCGFTFSTTSAVAAAAAGFQFASFRHLLQQLGACCFACFLLLWFAQLVIVVVFMFPYV